MTQNLLTKTLRWYIAFAVAILLVSAPISYSLIQHLFFDDAKETLKINKHEFLHDHLPDLKESEIGEWNRFNRNEKILPRKSELRKDRIKHTIIYDSLANENEPYLTLQSPIQIEGKPYIYFAKINLIEREDVVKSLAMLFVGLISVMLIGLYFITKILSVRLWRPFYVGLAHLEKFEVDKSASINLTSTSTNEFIRLNQAIENLIYKNTSIYNDQKEFVENAAHELQTPLAVIQGKLEMLQQSNLSQNQSEILEKLNESVARLSRLNKNLLLLSRIEHDQFSEFETISLKELVNKHLEFFSEQASAKSVDIEIKGEQPINIKANPVLAEVLLNNLLLNAIRHNISGGKILIVLAKSSLSIANTGADTPLLSEKIFDRFSKTNPSSQGTGLGLAIVKKIADLNRWKIKYSFDNKLHIFSIVF